MTQLIGNRRIPTCVTTKIAGTQNRTVRFYQGMAMTGGPEWVLLKAHASYKTYKHSQNYFYKEYKELKPERETSTNSES